ncbi:hypothetical protein NPIL_345971 [Nephila pilipes]|uniref:Uncharacterized protein n=1 Tax=Nephila pilipes TaxID=299642 RepID=A0A8X6P351_NEPPI|nr:hypothetical protein NPIL_345971 [Nephila pilipes]
MTGLLKTLTSFYNSKKLNNVHTEHVWFQEVRTTIHTSRRSLGVLMEMFPGNLISLRGRHRVASAFTRFKLVRHFPLGIPKAKDFQPLSSISGGFELRNLVGNRHYSTSDNEESDEEFSRKSSTMC